MAKEINVPAATIPAATLSLLTAMAAATTPTARKKYFASMFISCYFAQKGRLCTILHPHCNIITFLKFIILFRKNDHFVL